MSELYLPFLMSEEELFETIQNVDFWGDSVTENDFAIVDQLHALNTPIAPAFIDESNDNESFLRELASVRGMIIDRIGFGHFQNVLKYGENHINTPKKRALFDSIAESINENSFLYSDQFFQKYSNCGNVDFGHICEIIANERSYTQLETELTTERAQIIAENESILESYNAQNFVAIEPQNDDFDWSTGEYITFVESAVSLPGNIETHSILVEFPSPTLKSEPKPAFPTSGNLIPNPMIFHDFPRAEIKKLNSLFHAIDSIALFLVFVSVFLFKTVSNLLKTKPAQFSFSFNLSPFTLNQVISSHFTHKTTILPTFHLSKSTKTTYLSTLFRFPPGPVPILSG